MYGPGPTPRNSAAGQFGAAYARNELPRKTSGILSKSLFSVLDILLELHLFKDTIANRKNGKDYTSFLSLLPGTLSNGPN